MFKSRVIVSAVAVASFLTLCSETIAVQTRVAQRCQAVATQTAPRRPLVDALRRLVCLRYWSCAPCAAPEIAVEKPQTPATATPDALGKPEVVAPETAVKPEVAEPDVDEPEVAEPVADEPEVAAPDVDEPEVAEPDVDEPEVAEPDADEPEVAEPVADEPEVAEPVADEPEVAAPVADEPEVAAPDADEPEVAEPDVDEPEVVEPVADEPEVAAPDADEPEVAQVSDEELRAKLLGVWTNVVSMENLGVDGTVRSTYTFAEDGTCQTTVETTVDIENAIAGVAINPEDLNTLATVDGEFDVRDGVLIFTPEVGQATRMKLEFVNDDELTVTPVLTKELEEQFAELEKIAQNFDGQMAEIDATVQETFGEETSELLKAAMDAENLKKSALAPQTWSRVKTVE